MDFEISQQAESEPESEVVHGGSAKSIKAAQVQATAWTFDREWNFIIAGQEDVHSIAEFILENDVRKRMPPTLCVTYLVVLLHVFVSTATGMASTQMKGYIQCSKKVSKYALTKWFPEDEGTCILVVSGGLCGNSSYESDMKKEFPWMIRTLIGEIRLNNSGKRRVRFRPPHLARNISIEIYIYLPCKNYFRRNSIISIRLYPFDLESSIFLAPKDTLHHLEELTGPTLGPSTNSLPLSFYRLKSQKRFTYI